MIAIEVLIGSMIGLMFHKMAKAGEKWVAEMSEYFLFLINLYIDLDNMRKRRTVSGMFRRLEEGRMKNTSRTLYIHNPKTTQQSWSLSVSASEHHLPVVEQYCSSDALLLFRSHPLNGTVAIFFAHFGCYYLTIWYKKRKSSAAQ